MGPIPWFKVDDQLAVHMKAVTAGNAAMGLWVRAGSWCMAQLTDGFVPDAMVVGLGATPTDAEGLVSSGLWHAAEGGFQFHDWGEYQPTRDQVLAEREATRQRVAKHRENKGRNDARNGVTNGVGTTPPSPVPSPDSSTYVYESSYVSNRARETPVDKSARGTLAGLSIDADRLMTHIAQHLHLDVSPSAALRVALDLLDKGNNVKKPQAYVLGSITRSSEEVRQFIYENGLAA